jgi:hypothetical protein
MLKYSEGFLAINLLRTDGFYNNCICELKGLNKLCENFLNN